jgi:hypothetical protein
MPSTLQNVMIGEELLTAIRLLKTGLRELNRMDGSTDFFHLPILILASGFERLMKTVICCHHLETTGDYPDRSIFPKGKKGHDLVILSDMISRDCFSNRYLQKVPAAKSDIDFLRNDIKITRIVRILSDFGQGARYYNLNVVLGATDPGPSPEEEWQKLEMEILKEDPKWESRVTDFGKIGSIHKQINDSLTIQCEKLARALARLYTIGGLGDLAMKISSHTHHFLFLTDEKLGATNYEKIVI